jgi:iron complex outermembrane receptor protein
MRIYFLMILLLSSFPLLSQSCDYTLSGVLTDLHDGSVLEGATLIVAGSERFVFTDFEGKFMISNLCNETYSIQVSHPYCLTKGFSVIVSGDTFKSFKLEHHLEVLNEISIDRRIVSNQSKTLQENILSKEELERFGSRSLGDALASLSGVSSLNTGNTVIKPMINGLHSSRVVIINNGVRMEDQEWGAELAPNIDVNAVNKLTLIKGAGALQYSGDAIGGVIIAETAIIPFKDSLFGNTQLGGASNGKGTFITTELTKSYENGWYASMQASLKRFGDFETADYILSNTGVNQQNAFLKAGFNSYDHGFEVFYSFFQNEIGILRASHVGSAQDLYRAIGSDRPLIINEFTYDIIAPKQEVAHHLARIKAYKRIGELGKLSVQYDYQKNKRLEFDIRRGSDRGNASLDLELFTHTLMLDLDAKATDKSNLKIGVMGSYQNNVALNTGVRRLIPDYDKYDFGAYLIGDYRSSDQWLFEIGARFDYTQMNVFKFYRNSFWESRNYDQLFPELVVEEFGNQILTNPKLNFHNGSGTFGIVHNLDEKYKLFFNYSLTSRIPNPSELFSEGLHHSASRIELGDLTFNPEIGQKLSFTLERKEERFSYSINPYLNNILDFIVIEPITINSTIRGTFQVWEYRQTNAQLLGIDFDAAYVFNKALQFNHQASIVKGIDRIQDEALINMPPVNTTIEIVYYSSKIKNLRLALQSEYVFRQNEFPNTDFEIYIPETETQEMVEVSSPPPAYHLLNFNSSIDFNFSEQSTLTVGFQITNMLNSSYRNYLNRMRLFADDLGRNFSVNIKLNY